LYLPGAVPGRGGRAGGCGGHSRASAALRQGSIAHRQHRTAASTSTTPSTSTAPYQSLVPALAPVLVLHQAPAPHRINHWYQHQHQYWCCTKHQHRTVSITGTSTSTSTGAAPSTSTAVAPAPHCTDHWHRTEHQHRTVSITGTSTSTEHRHCAVSITGASTGTPLGTPIAASTSTAPGPRRVPSLLRRRDGQHGSSTALGTGRAPGATLSTSTAPGTGTAAAPALHGHCLPTARPHACPAHTPCTPASPLGRDGHQPVPSDPSQSRLLVHVPAGPAHASTGLPHAVSSHPLTRSPCSWQGVPACLMPPPQRAGSCARAHIPRACCPARAPRMLTPARDTGAGSVGTGPPGCWAQGPGCLAAGAPAWHARGHAAPSPRK